jgi:hypothetical protein
MARSDDEDAAIAALLALRRQRLESAEQRLARAAAKAGGLRVELAVRSQTHSELDALAAECRAARTPFMASLVDEPVRRSLQDAAQTATDLVLAEAKERAARRHLAEAFRGSEVWSAVATQRAKRARRKQDLMDDDT